MYKQLYKPGHHRADVTGLVSEHILIAEVELDRPLKKGEITHHKDFNKFNNDLANLLFPITRREHQLLPMYQARFIIAKGLYKEFLAWWRQAQKKDTENSNIKEIERKLVKATNARERDRKYERNENANNSPSEDNLIST